MNTTTRRLVTALAGAALTASAIAATSPAAFAGKGGKTAQTITVYAGGYGVPDGGIASLSVDYTVPVAPSAITSVTCTLDGVAQTYCGDRIGNATKSTNYWGYVIYDEVVHVDHTFTVKVVTTKGTYTGSAILNWTL